MKKLILIILFSAVWLCNMATTFEDIRSQVRFEYLEAVPAADVAEYAVLMGDDGKWPDIDYQDNSTSLWQLEKHLDRLVDMALVLGNDSATSPVLYEAVVRGLNQWFDGNYSNSNWWYTKIGVPRRMLALAYLLDGMLPADIKTKINSSLDIIDSDDFPARPGGDRIQVLGNHAKVLLWRRDYAGISDIFKKIENEACFAPFEETMYDAGGGLAVRNSWRPSGRGVQKDMSFHHRGDRVDSTLTYGLELPEFFTYWAILLEESEWAFPASAVNFIIDYYLDGISRHLVAGKYAEPSIMNRELSRPGAGAMSSNIATGLLAICDGYRENELLENLDILKGVRNFNQSYAANFMESGYFSFCRPSFQTAVRYHSKRNSNQEAAHNREGIRNHFRGDGACMLSVTGKEYADIAPLFDFRKIPGATTPLLPYEPLSEWGDVQILDSPVNFAGAVSDSIYGVVAFDFISERLDLKARKGYFFFDDEYLCLGSSINSDSPFEIVTTVEQCLSPSGELSEDSGWFFHSGNAYHVMDGNADGNVTRRKGTWANCVENVEYATTPSEADIFTLAITHGIRPGNEKYAYAVIPGRKEKCAHSFEIIANEPNCQAVAAKNANLLYIIFYEPGVIATPYGDFNSDEPCIMMIRDGKEKKYFNHE